MTVIIVDIPDSVVTDTITVVIVAGIIRTSSSSQFAAELAESAMLEFCFVMPLALDYAVGTFSGARGASWVKQIW